MYVCLSLAVTLTVSSYLCYSLCLYFCICLAWTIIVVSMSISCMFLCLSLYFIYLSLFYNLFDLLINSTIIYIVCQSLTFWLVSSISLHPSVVCHLLSPLPLFSLSSIFLNTLPFYHCFYLCFCYRLCLIWYCVVPLLGLPIMQLYCLPRQMHKRTQRTYVVPGM